MGTRRNRKDIKILNKMRLNNKLIKISIGWAIFSLAFLSISLSLQALSGSWSYTLYDGNLLYGGNGFNSVAISGDGNYIITSTWEDDVLCFSTSKNEPLWIYDKGYQMECVAISFDGNYMVIGSGEGKIYLFNKSSSIPIWIYDAGHSIIEVDISYDGNYIACAASGDTFLFQKDSQIPLWSAPGSDIALCDNGNYIAISTSGSVSLYNVSSSVQLWSWSSSTYRCSELAISSTGEYIVLGCHYFTSSLMLFNRLSSTPIWTFEVDNYINGLDISSDGNYIVAGWWGDPGAKIYFFNKLSSIPQWYYDVSTFDISSTIEFSGNGQFILIGTYSEKSHLFHRSNNIPIWMTPHGSQGTISSTGKEFAIIEVNKLYFFNSNYVFPTVIEDFFIPYITIFSILGMLSLVLLVKMHQRKKLLKKEEMQREDLQKILRHSNRVSKKMVRTALGIDKSTFDEKISNWATEFGFKIDGDYIFITNDDFPEFIKELDEKYEEWKDLKKIKKV